METEEYFETRSHDDEIDLLKVVQVLRAGRLKILCVTLVFAIFSILYALSIPNQYKAIAVLAPAKQDGGTKAGASKLTSIASLAGLSLSGGSVSESAIAQNIMLSWSFIDQFVTSNNFEPQLLAVEEWNEASNQMIFNHDVYDHGSDDWITDASSGLSLSPSSWEIYEEFSARFSLTQDRKTKLITVSFEHYSPYVAKEWLDEFVVTINKHMQNRKVEQVTKNMTYLEEQIEKTSIAEMREVFYTIIEEQIKDKMLAEASPDYAFVTVSPSMIPEQKSQPQRSVICVFGTLFGGFLSVAWVLTSHYRRKEASLS